MSGGQSRAHEPLRPLELAMPVDEALVAVERAAEVWGAEWQRAGTGGRLALPVTAGIRYGMAEGEVTAERRGTSSAIRFEIERVEYKLHLAALAVLLLGAAGALLTLVAPLHPALLELLPITGLLALLAWFLVVSRVRNRSAADFLALVESVAARDDAKPGTETGEAATR